MRFIVVLLYTLFAGNAPVSARQYRNLDSLITSGLLFVGGTDRYEYGYLDTVHVVFRVVNRTPSTLTIYGNTSCLFPAWVDEVWCTPEGVCPVAEPWNPGCISTWPPHPLGFEVAPGESTLVERAWESPFWPVPGNRLRFESGAAKFLSPWWVPPRFQFAVPFVRRPPTALEARSWSTVKALF